MIYHAATLPDSANSLGGVSLPLGVVWIDQRQYAGYSQSRRRAISGDLDLIVSPAFSAGRPVTLRIEWPRSALYAAKYTALAATLTPGAVLSLVWDAVTYSVVWRQDEPPALDMQILDSIGAGPLPRDLGVYVGDLKLMTVIP